MTSLQWYAYEHENGSFHLRRYFALGDVREARMSPFVAVVVGPFPAECREEAEALGLDMIRNEKRAP